MRIRGVGAVAFTASIASISCIGLASCGFGVTGSADQVTAISARLHGTASNTIAGGTSYGFEYGPTDAYGSWSSSGWFDNPAAGGSQEVFQTVAGLTDDTTYHYRLCVHDADGTGSCGADGTFTTAAGDFVRGSGLVTTIFLGPPLSYQLQVGGSIAASAAPDGSTPSGDGTVMPSTFAQVAIDAGTVTCLRVVGNRAAIGLVIPSVQIGVPPHYEVAFVEDNGPTGDRWDASPNLSAPGTTCPVPTAADFDGFWFFNNGSFTNYGSTLTSGDFVVHDHP